MMAGIVVIAIIGLALEKFVFQKIENYTVVRWGMITVMTESREHQRSILRGAAYAARRGGAL